MARFIKWLAAVGGTILSALGLLGAACAVCAPVCGAACISGILVTFLGTGAAIFFHKYSLWITSAGVLATIIGIILIAKSLIDRKRCDKAS